MSLDSILYVVCGVVSKVLIVFVCGLTAGTEGKGGRWKEEAGGGTRKGPVKTWGPIG